MGSELISGKKLHCFGEIQREAGREGKKEGKKEKRKEERGRGRKKGKKRWGEREKNTRKVASHDYPQII